MYLRKYVDNWAHLYSTELSVVFTHIRRAGDSYNKQQCAGPTHRGTEIIQSCNDQVAGDSSPPSDRREKERVMVHLHFLQYSDMFGSCRFVSVVPLRLGPQVWFQAPTTGSSEPLIKPCAGDRMHQVCKWCKDRVCECVCESVHIFKRAFFIGYVF